MSPYNLDVIETSLHEKQQQVMTFLEDAPAEKQLCCLGDYDTHPAQEHLQVIDTTLERVAEETWGVCEVCHGHVDDELLAMDYTACVCLEHFSADERRRLEYELELSQAVQKALLPQKAPRIPGLEVAVFSQPSHIIGGDFFDFFHYEDGAFGLAIADVAGHGVSASLLMASLQTALRTLAPLHTQPADLVNHLNRFFIHNIHFTSFVTLFVGRLDAETHTLHYSNAGHNPPLLHRSNGNGKSGTTWLRPTGPAIGLVEQSLHTTRTTEVNRGDLLVLYTDGVTETMNGERELFGEERLEALVSQQATQPAHELLQSLRHALTVFSDDQPLADDTTVVVSRFHH